jgi:hypothetical protein
MTDFFDQSIGKENEEKDVRYSGSPERDQGFFTRCKKYHER